MVANGTLMRHESHDELISAHPALSGGGTAMQVRSSYATAVSVQRPRVLANVETKLLEEADKAGTLFYYGWGAGKDAIEGASIHLANAAVRLWGNCAIELLPVQETRDAWIFTAAYVDLETGFTLQRQFRQSKTWTVYGKHDEARKEDIRFQIGQSKAVRNVILNAIPKWLTKRAVEKAKAGVREELEEAINDKGIEAIRGVLMKRLAGEGVTEPMVLAKFGRPTSGGLTIEDMVIMRADYDALNDGADTVDHLYPPETVEPVKPSGTKSDGLADKLASKSKAIKDVEKSDDAPPLTPATETSDLSNELATRIGDAETVADLDALRGEIKAAQRAKRITANQSVKLVEKLNERGDMLAAEASQDAAESQDGDPFAGR